MSEDHIVKRREHITIGHYLSDGWFSAFNPVGADWSTVRSWKDGTDAIRIDNSTENISKVEIFDASGRWARTHYLKGPFEDGGIEEAERVFMEWAIEMSGLDKNDTRWASKMSEKKVTIDDYLSRWWETLENGTQLICRVPTNPTNCIKKWKNGGIAIRMDAGETPKLFFIRLYDASGVNVNTISYYGDYPIEEAEKVFMDWTLTATELPKPADEAPGRKDHEGKMPWHLLPWKECEEIVKVLRFGAKKYSENNWMKVNNPKDMYFRALISHVSEWRKGNTHDEESGLHHLAHAACNCLFLMWFDDQGKG